MIIVEGLKYITLAVTDLEKSTHFYSDIFDFEVLEETKTENSVILELEPVHLRLVQVGKVENQLTKLKIPLLSFEVDVDDFTEAIGELEEREIRILIGPELQGEGERLVFEDPDKNLVEIFYK